MVGRSVAIKNTPRADKSGAFISVVAVLSGVQDTEGPINIELSSHRPHISDFTAAYDWVSVSDTPYLRRLGGSLPGAAAD